MKFCVFRHSMSANPLFLNFHTSFAVSKICSFRLHFRLPGLSGQAVTRIGLYATIENRP